MVSRTQVSVALPPSPPRGGGATHRRATAASQRPAELVAAPLPSLDFGRAICGSLAEAERREWWLANSRGAYASGTIALSQTRRYHGLLIAPIDPPLGRALVLAKADATLIDGDREWPLFTNRWGSGSVAPSGYQNIEHFALDGTVPVWRFAIGDIRLEARIWMEHGANTTYVAYRLDPDTPAREVRLRVTLLANDRDHHGLTGSFAPRVEQDAARLRVVDDGRYALTLQPSGGTISPHMAWYGDFDLPVERERGLTTRDDHLVVGIADLTPRPGGWVGITASLEPDSDTDLAAALARRQAHDRSLLAQANDRVAEMRNAPMWIRQLLLAADSFVFARPLADVPDGDSVIAGYPWFGDWGRDTMIALPGLTLATGRHDSARRILQTFTRFVDQGMLPNVFLGAGETPEYNTVDAALWFIEAWRAYVDTTDDDASLVHAYPVLADIIAWHQRGTRYGIGVDPADGLLRAGEPGVQLTWMDAKVGDWVVTPRIGKPVEINALWYNALMIMAGFARRLGHADDEYIEAAERVRTGFARFIDPAGGGLFDVLDGPEGDDATVRPNQIFAVSLPHSPLTTEQQAKVVATCGHELLTSYGLRSLSPDHPDFRPHYQGGVWERDGGYHQGPVWGWLLGHYALAAYRVHGDATAAQQLLAPLADHLSDAGLGTISEIFDGAAPHTPRGCPAQAWSVACTLEAWWRLEQVKAASQPTSPMRPSRKE